MTEREARGDRRRRHAPLNGVAAGLVFALCVASGAAVAQGATLRGRVLTAGTERPVAGAQVSVEGGASVITDSSGAFTITGVAPGARVVAVRKIGFDAFQTRLDFRLGVATDADLLLTPSVQQLPGVSVEVTVPANAKLREFEERRAIAAAGHFLVQADFDKRASSLTSDILRPLPGIDMVRDSRRGSAMFVVGGRMQAPRGAFDTGGSRPRPCFAAVVLDGAFVFSGLQGEPPFDINSIGPAHIAGLEFYASSASIPARYGGTRNTCGLVVIWTR